MVDMGKRCAMGFRPFQNEQGAILAVALIFVCILAISGTVAYRMTANELLIARNFDDSREALNAGSAGIEEARVRLGLPSTDTFAIYDPATGSSYPDPDWIATPTSLQTDPPYQIEVIHKTVSPSGFYYYGYEDPFSSLTISAFPSSSPTEYRPIDIITSTGTGENSGIEIQAEVSHNPGPPILAALYAENGFDCDSSNTITIRGTDQCTMGNCPFCQNVSKYKVYIYPSTVDPDTAVTCDDYHADVSSSDIQLGDVNININQGITSLKAWETSSTPSDCYNTNYEICSSSGDLIVPVSTIGSGVLMVEGNLTLEGTTWDGLILVTGELTLNGGTGGILIEGAVLVNGKVWINDTNPGDVTINYNSCAIDAALSSIPLRVLSWEDLSITQ